MRKYFHLSLYLLVLIFGAGLQGCFSDPENKNAYDELLIRKADGDEVTYSIEVADTNESRQMGLMFRDSMDEDHGMLLDFNEPEEVSIWMKNTYIPLDLIYINKNGEIVYLHKGAIPHDTTPIRSGVMVKSVLEVNANQIDKQGLKIGDRVIHRIYGTD